MTNDELRIWSGFMAAAMSTGLSVKDSSTMADDAMIELYRRGGASFDEALKSVARDRNYSGSSGEGRPGDSLESRLAGLREKELAPSEDGVTVLSGSKRRPGP